MSKFRHKAYLPAPQSNGQPHQARPTGPAPADEQKLNFGEIWSTIREGKWVILATCALVAVIVAGYTMTLTPVYEASSIVHVNTIDQRPTDMMTTERRYLSIEVGVLRNSLELAERVARRVLETADALGTDAHFSVLAAKNGEKPNSRDIAYRLQAMAKFEMMAQESMISIKIESEVPEEAATIANLYAQEYEVFSRERSRASLVAGRSFLEEQVQRFTEDLDRLNNEWEAFARQREVVTLGAEGERLVAEYSALQARRNEANFQLEQERAAMGNLEARLNEVEPSLRDAVIEEGNVAGLQRQIEQLNESIAQARVQLEGYYANNPDLRGNERTQGDATVRDLANRVERYEQRRNELYQEIVGRASGMGVVGGDSQLGYVSTLRARMMERQLAKSEIESQISYLDRVLGGYRGRLSGIPRQAIELDLLEQKIGQTKAWRDAFMQDLQRTQIAEQSELGYISTLRRASVPWAPVRPNIRQNIILGFLLGLGFGIGLAFVRKAVDNRLQRPEDLQENGYSLMGVIPPMDRLLKTSFDGQERIEVEGASLSTRLVTLLDPWSPISENYRLVRTNLQHAQPDSALQAILVTSPEASDGKSVTAMNLAIAMAQSGRRTLIVDCDLRRPSAHTLLGRSQTPGVAELLDGSIEVDPDAFATQIEGLSFIPAGKANTPPAELMGSPAMDDLIKKLRKIYDVIIIDSPPILAVTDSVLLSMRCDATVLVVAAHRTDRRALDVARQTLEAVGTPIAGTIFNRFDGEKAGGYTYRYGYYGDYTYGQTA
jgi:polysaccharide biosynthesis transport protein